MRNIQVLLLGALFIVALATGGIFLVSEVNDYNNDLLTQNGSSQWAALNNTFAAMDESMTNITSSVNSTFDSEANERDFGFLDDLIRTVTNTLKSIGRSMSLFSTFFTSMDDFLPIPSWVGSLMASAIVIIIGFAIWKAIFKVT